MGNEQSQIPGIEIDRKVIEVSDFWTQHSASISSVENISKLTIFIGDLFINETFWSPITPLERFSKNLMIYRHPCIIKYISSWQKTSKFHLAVEEVTPLSQMISKMSTLEICLGLYSILKALCFLHEKALVSHNNICLASIFVNKEGSWKLGGMEYLCQYKELSADYLKKSRQHRYSKAFDSNEDKNLKNSSERKDFIDLYAFCTLVKELLKNRSDDDISVSSFKDFCKSAVETTDIFQRPKLISLLEQEFFKHKFITIHSYLIELPLKSDSDKTEFFSSLKDELELLSEEVVASHLGGLLVSRIVLLNKTAQTCMLPFILVPRTEENGALFSEDIFRKYIAPKLLKIFCVRDAQIRFLLLSYFPHFLHCFSIEELRQDILPELLVGIKDTNNDLVAATLRTLADLVPVLGAETVIGGKRAKLFIDGRPKSQNFSRKGSSRLARQDVLEPEMILPSIDQLSITSSMVELIQNQNGLPERPRPDGEEGETSTDEIEQSADEDVENWEDWDNENVDPNITLSNTELAESSTETNLIQNNAIKTTQQSTVKKPKKIVDITELDIKNQTKIVLEQNEVDFFQDMEPVIEPKRKFLIGDNKKEDAIDSISNKLTVNVEDTNEDGWGDDWE